MRFSNLEAEIARIGMSPERLGAEIGMSKQIIYNRLNGKTKWTLAEMLKIQRLINSKGNAKYTLDYLFAMGVRK